MLKEFLVQRLLQHTLDVLILILMEHAQRVCHRVIGVKNNGVLILILMEHAQREHFL